MTATETARAAEAWIDAEIKAARNPSRATCRAAAAKARAAAAARFGAAAKARAAAD